MIKSTGKYYTLAYCPRALQQDTVDETKWQKFQMKVETPGG